MGTIVEASAKSQYLGAIVLAARTPYAHGALRCPEPLVLFLGIITLNQSAAPGRDVQARIDRLLVYPVKSCAGVELREAVLTETGLDLDRSWMVVDAGGDFVSQREAPRLALVRPTMKMHEVILRAPGMLALHLGIETVEQAVAVRVWDEAVSAFDMGDIAAQWFTDFLAMRPDGSLAANAQRYRLVRFDPDHKRLSSMHWTGGVEARNQFSDGFPLLVLSTASLEQLNKMLVNAGHAAVLIERFRPNIVLGGMQAHDEDRVGDLHVTTDSGDVRLKLVKPCARCPIPNIDHMTATSSSVVGDMLQTYRSDARVGGAVSFGMNAIVTRGFDQVLRVGQVARADYEFG